MVGESNDGVKVSCTWGDGPDVLLTLEGKPLVCYEHPKNDPPPKGQWKHGYITKGSMDMTAQEALRLAGQLTMAAKEAIGLDKSIREHEEREIAHEAALKEHEAGVTCTSCEMCGTTKCEH